MEKVSRTIRRRRREGRTDYKSRLGALKSGKARMIVRRSNKYFKIQIIESEIAQDKVVVNVSSKDLLGYGWPKEKEGSLKSLAAGYLTGILVAKKSKIKEAIFDIGLNRNMKGGKIYAVLKGAVEGGMDIPYGEDALPSDKRVMENEKTKSLIEDVKKKIGGEK